MPGLGIGLSIALGGTLLNLPFVEDLAFNSKVRTGLSLTDSISENNATLLFPYVNRTTIGLVGSVEDNGALDIGATDFTLCGWVNDQSLTNASVYIFFGKQVQGSLAGRYGFYTAPNDRKFHGFAQSSGTTIDIASTVVSNTAGWKFLLLDINQATKKIRFFIDNVQIGTDSTFTGTFPAMDNKYKFRLHGTNTTAGTSADSFVGHSCDIRVYNRLLTVDERAILFTKGNVDTVKAHWPMTTLSCFDISGNNYHPTFASLSGASIKYSQYGSNSGLSNGYDLYKSYALPNIHIPHVSNLSSITPTGLSAGYYNSKSVLNIDKLHNLYDSMILFANDFFDRSNTTIWNDYARAATSFFDVNNPKAWHISEMEINTIKLYANPGYLGMFYPVFYGDREYLKELFVYTTDKETTELKSALQYSKNYEAYHNIDYYFDARNIVATRDNYMLIFDSARYVQISIDGGVNILRQVDLGAANVIQFAYIYANGNILFGTQTKMYYSHDLLQTFTESTVLDINGDPFVPSTYDNFLRITPDDYFTINGIEMPVWGVYSNSGGTIAENINAWYTIDGGVTVKSFFAFIGTGAATDVTHIHAINKAPDGSFWMQTGDSYSANLTSRWYKCIYDIALDTWVVTLIKSGSYTDPWKTTGFVFKNDMVIYSSDTDVDVTRLGIFQVNYTDIEDATKYDRIYNTNNNGKLASNAVLSSILGNDTNIIATYWSGTKVIAISTNNGKSWFTHELTGGPVIDAIANSGYITIYPPNSAGYHLISIKEHGETYSNNFRLGTVLMLKITKP
jgi:hypothetical protein